LTESLIIGQEKPIRFLRRRIQDGTLPHALLFVGMAGIGKQSMAMAMAMALNCQNPIPLSEDTWAEGSFSSDGLGSCGQCRSCRKISADLHPDMIKISASGSTIRIEQIRRLCDTLTLKPFEAAMRIALIADAHTMTPSAANALLKVLEEPPPRTILILTALHGSGLLPTIVSRCQIVRFAPIQPREMARYLEQNHGLSTEEAIAAAELGNGSIPKTLSWTTREAVSRREWILETLSSLDSDTISTCLAFAEKLLENKTGLQEDLNLVKTWLRDLIIYTWAPMSIIHKDKVSMISKRAPLLSVQNLLEIMNQLQSVQYKIQTNLNPRLALEILMLSLKQALQPLIPKATVPVT
jgi:DNA polymerase III subunit delta'